MLEELRIRGLGVIEDAVLPLEPGLTVVTGETGAGKTMVVTGLLLLFGGRADAARVRAGSSEASVDGLVQVVPSIAERVYAAGGHVDDGTGLVLRRVVNAAGRSKAYVGGTAAPVALLAELSEGLVTVHGQSDQLRLTRRSEQLGALDRFGNVDTSAYTEAFGRWRAAADGLSTRLASAAQLRREAEVLESGIKEIDAATPLPGEDVELTALSSRLAHADALRIAARSAHDALSGNPEDPTSDTVDVGILLGGARHALEQQSGADAELDALTVRVAELGALTSDLAADLRDYTGHLDADPDRLAEIEARRSVLAGLVRKYGDERADVVSVLDWAAQARERLADLDVSDDAIAALTAERDAAASAVRALAAELTTVRSAAARTLSSAVSAELEGLAMAGAALAIEVLPRGSGQGAFPMDEVVLGHDGGDDVNFLLRPHPGSPALPIAKGASGGELSRVMLAIEVCLAGTEPVPTMVFDEVDAGVGGRAAVEVGRRLARLGRQHQVIVVTHLAQVAAYADHHVVVDKAQDAADRAVVSSDVRVVQGDDRVAELARMLAGTESDAARRHAVELLATAAEDGRRNPDSGVRPRRGGAKTKG